VVLVREHVAAVVRTEGREPVGNRPLQLVLALRPSRDRKPGDGDERAPECLLVRILARPRGVELLLWEESRVNGERLERARQ
jgi:hypothetical protein